MFDEIDKYEQWVDNHSISLQLEFMKEKNIQTPEQFDEDTFWDWSMDKFLQEPPEIDYYYETIKDSRIDDLIYMESER